MQSSNPINKKYIKNVIQKLDRFLSPDDDLSAQLLSATKWFFDSGKTHKPTFSPLPELLVDAGFDQIQIWEQMMLEFYPKLEYLDQQIKLITPTITSEQESSISGEESMEASDDNEDYLSDIPEEDESNELDNISDEPNLEENDIDMMSEVSSVESSHPENPAEIKEHGLNDKFFSIDEMEKFADIMDEKEEKKRKREEMGHEYHDEELIDSELLFEDPDDNMQDSDSGDDDQDNANDIKYSDFFEAKPTNKKFKSFEENEELEQDFSNDEKTLQESEDEGLDFEQDQIPAQSSNLLDDEEDKNNTQNLSTYEKQQIKMKKIIEALESEAVGEKEWAMKGEVSAKKRPSNSLLEKDLDVEYSMKPVPIITEEVTLSLEDLIKQRIKDELWDDVVRKVVVKEKAFDPNRKANMSDEKNSKSLADIYEQEYVRQTQDNTEEFKSEKDDALKLQHDEIDTLFKGLCQSLDALSNWHYTPKAPVIELQVLPSKDTPALTMEEIMPSTVSDAQLIAPEEVYKVKVGKSREEMDADDRKRLRAKTKLSKKKINQEKVKATKDAAATKKTSRSRLSDKSEKDAALKELMTQENVTIIADNSTKKTLDGSKKLKANVIQKGDKVRQERKRERSEFIRL